VLTAKRYDLRIRPLPTHPRDSVRMEPGTIDHEGRFEVTRTTLQYHATSRRHERSHLGLCNDLAAALDNPSRQSSANLLVIHNSSFRDMDRLDTRGVRLQFGEPTGINHLAHDSIRLA